MGFNRQFAKLAPLRMGIKNAFADSVCTEFPTNGLRIGIYDDSPIKKSGKKFPKGQIHHEHTSNTYYNGMKVLSSAICQCGKMAVVDSQLVGKQDSKLELAERNVSMLITDFLVDIFLFDSWFCKHSLLAEIDRNGKYFISRMPCNRKCLIDEDEIRLDALFKGTPHREYENIQIHGKSYWVFEAELYLPSHGNLRVIISKDGQHAEPIFIVTNIQNMTAKAIVTLYLKRFNIEIFFKDAKQFLNLETFMCRSPQRWDLHLLLTNVLHWAIQKRNSISRTICRFREDFVACLLFINRNQLLEKFFDELRRKCQT